MRVHIDEGARAGGRDATQLDIACRIMVAIDNAGAERPNEYLPTYDEKHKYGGKADLFAKMLFEEIKPMIDREFRTKPEAKNTAFVGSSYGGVLALHLGLTNSSKLGKIGVVSPSLDWDDDVMIRSIDALTTKLPVKIWLDAGTQEWSKMVSYMEKAADALESKGWKKGKDLMVYVDGWAVHNEAAWARRLPVILLYLFARKGVF